MSGAFATDLKAENFTVSDALKKGPPQFDSANKDYYNNLQAMSQVLSRPNQFMARGKWKITVFEILLELSVLSARNVQAFFVGKMGA